MTASVGGSEVRETSSLKMLGVHFDRELNFKKYWSEIQRPINQKIYAIGHLRSRIPFLSRKELGQGLVISKLGYCLVATSSCPKSVLRALRNR